MDHFLDCAKVNGIVSLAFAVSLSNLENTLRLAGLAAALLYTIMKIAQLFKNWNSKEKDE